MRFPYGFLSFFLLLFPNGVSGQFFYRPVADTTTRQGIGYHVEAGGLASTSSRTPFWLRANQFGTVPTESPSGILLAGATGQWGDVRQNRKPTFKAGVEIAAAANRHSRVVLQQAYAAVRLGHGELYVGRRKEINGITDTLLTSGSYAWSGNAIPITQIRLGTRDYAPLKFTNGLVSVNAFFSHGWFANTDSMQRVYLHAKAVYVRIGKPNWKIRLYGGMSHYVQWGGYSKYLGKGYADNGHLASGWEGFKAAMWPGKIEGNTSGKFSTFDTTNRAGNHLGSIDFALEIPLRQSNLLFYIQHPWEDMSGVVFGNLPDGLYGLRWKNQRVPSGSFRVDQITAEYLTTLDQSGPVLPKGADDYFNNYQYLDGWTHKQRVIGTPFIARVPDVSAEWQSLKGGVRSPVMIVSNRLTLFHLGVKGQVNRHVRFTTLLSYSHNYGRPMRPAPVTAIGQFSGIVGLDIHVGEDLYLNPKYAFDYGKFLPGNQGIFLTVSKRFYSLSRQEAGRL